MTNVTFTYPWKTRDRWSGQIVDTEVAVVLPPSAARAVADSIYRQLYATPTLALPEVRALVQQAVAEALHGPWSDTPDDLTEAVTGSHPVVTRTNWDTYNAALEAVSNRHSKGSLVALVNYLMLAGQDAVKAARKQRNRST